MTFELHLEKEGRKVGCLKEKEMGIVQASRAWTGLKGFPTCTSHGCPSSQEGADTSSMPGFSFVSPNSPRLTLSVSRVSFSSHSPQINVPEESETSLEGAGGTPGGLPRIKNCPRLQEQETF